jgi:hypothetical protein
VTIELLVQNNASSLTFADIDTVTLEAESYAELQGTVKDQSNTRLRNADVVIKNAKKAVVWSGTTNKKGKFTATGLRGNTKAYFVTIRKNERSKRFRVRLAWAELKGRNFVLP